MLSEISSQFGLFIRLAMMIFVGMFFGRLAKHCKLPNVTGYLIGGLIIGPSVLGLIPESALADLDVIADAALGFIAFSIGSEFKISYFKRVGLTPIVIACLEALLGVVFVVIALLVAGFELPFSLVLGSIAAATAPAATIMVIKQYKAKGPVTETLLSVVAIDDAVALMLFGIAVAVAQAVSDPEASVASALLDPIVEILGALVFGLILGLIFTIPLRFFKKDGNRLALTIAFVFLGIGLAEIFGFSQLLLCMALGASLTNVSSHTTHIAKLTDGLTPPIFILFFVLSGAELQISVLPSIGLAGLLYIVFRVVGKVLGASLGSVACHADPKITKYLGWSLMPQAGVAIGLSLLATQIVPDFGQQIRAIILCGTFIYELIGPAVTKLSLRKAGEIE